MKIKKQHLRWAIPGALALVSTFALVAWQNKPADSPVRQQYNDTTPSKQKIRVEREAGDKDFDFELRQLDNAQQRLKEVDWEQINKSVEEALNNIKTGQIEAQVELALKAVDMEKIQRTVEEALSKIDFKQIERDVEEAVKSALSEEDKAQIESELAEARKEIATAKEEVARELKKKDWKKEMDEARKESAREAIEEIAKVKKEMAEARKEIKLDKLNMDKEMKNAHLEIEKAKTELKGYQEMVYGLEKEGLLDTKKDYKIEYKSGLLHVNGQQQSTEVSNKYKKYFSKDNVTIEKENGRIDIDND